MDIKAHSKNLLALTRRMGEAIIPSLQSDDDWYFSTCPNSNPAIWIVAHLGLADNYFMSRFRPELDQKPAGWDKLFWFGSEMKEDRSLYPNSSEIVDYYRERRVAWLKLIDDLTDEELNRPAPPAGSSSPIAGAPNLGQVLLFAPVHEGIHVGQLTVCHRGLGHGPIRKPE